MFDDDLSRERRELAIGRPTRHRKRRDDAHGIAGRKAFHAGTDRLNNPGRLEAKARRKARRLEIKAGTQHGFRAIETQRLDLYPNLSRTGRRDINILNPQYFGTTKFMKSNDAGHGFHAPNQRGNDLEVMIAFYSVINSAP